MTKDKLISIINETVDYLTDGMQKIMTKQVSSFTHLLQNYQLKIKKTMIDMIYIIMQIECLNIC